MALAATTNELWNTAGNKRNFQLPNNVTDTNVCKKKSENISDILSEYQKEFGCSESSPSNWSERRENYTRRFQTAKKCLTRRIKTLGKYNAETPENKVARSRHLYPIKTAYTLGRNCLRKFTTRKNAVNIFTDSVNRRLRSIGKPNVLYNEHYGLSPSIKNHINEAELGNIFRRNYGMSRNEWNAMYESRFANRVKKGEPNTFSETVKEAIYTNSNVNTDGPTDTMRMQRRTGGRAASKLTRGAGARSDMKEEMNLLKATIENTEKERERFAKNAAEKTALQTKEQNASFALFYLNHKLFMCLPLYFLELKTINVDSLMPETKKRFDELIKENKELEELYSKMILNPLVTDYIVTPTKKDVSAYNVEDASPFFKLAFDKFSKYNENISQFLLQTGICTSDRAREERQDAILNDVEDRSKLVSRFMQKLQIEMMTNKSKISDKCWNLLVMNLNKFHIILQEYYRLTKTLEKVQIIRPQAYIKDPKINTFPEFMAFYKRHQDLQKKAPCA